MHLFITNLIMHLFITNLIMRQQDVIVKLKDVQINAVLHVEDFQAGGNV
jgi:hypothetical protein